MLLSPLQIRAGEATGRLFLYGNAGTGKTSALHGRLRNLLDSGEPAYTLLVIIAELEQRDAYRRVLLQNETIPFTELKLITYASLAREMVTLFWPLVARDAGFERPYQPPNFLSYDLAQLLMWRVVNEGLEAGAFTGIRLRPQQIVSQLLDTLNRAALNRLTPQQAIERQIATWTGDAEHPRHLRQVERIALKFRRYCLDSNLLDMSLVVDVFDRQLVQHNEFSRYFSERFRHLIVDNLEEQTPAGQHFIEALMPAAVTTAVAYDAGGGYKRFLSADPQSGLRFRDLCDETLEFVESYVTPTPVAQIGNLVERYLLGSDLPVASALEGIWKTVTGRYRREVIEQLVLLLHDYIFEQGIPAHEIALIAPYLDGALRFALTQALGEAGIPYFVLRRRSSPREEPRIRAWLTWLALAHPNWGISPSDYDVAEALTLSIEGLDPARAALVAELVYRPTIPALLPIDEIGDAVAARVDNILLQRVEAVRVWLAENGGRFAVDDFLYRLFEELLMRADLRSKPDLAGAAICDWLVETAGRLRAAAANMGLESEADIGIALITSINQGLVTANPPDLGDPPDPAGVMLSTAYGFLLSERTATVQVWLETAALGWWDIPRQPLSNVFVLAESWPKQRLWTMEEEMRVRNRLLAQVVRGLTSRCSGGIVLAHSELDRRGQQQDGHLWRALQTR